VTFSSFSPHLPTFGWETSGSPPGRRLSGISMMSGQLTSIRSALRLRFLLSLLLVAVPLGSATWVFSDFAGASVRAGADARLRTDLRAAIEQYDVLLASAEVQARTLARLPGVQRALKRADRRQLLRLSEETPNTSFAVRGLVVGHVPPRAVERSIEIVEGKRPLGRIIVAVPLDSAFLAHLGQAVGVEPGDFFLLIDRGRISAAPLDIRGRAELEQDRAADVTLAGSSYRALGVPLGKGERLNLVVATPGRRIAAAASRVRKRIIWAGMGSLVALLVLVYAFAPAIAQSRQARRERTQAARLLSHIGEGVFLLDERGVIRFWNAAAEAITGLAAKALLGRPAAETLPGWPRLEPLVPVARQAREDDERVRATTLPFEFAQAELWLSISGTRFGDGTVYAFRDVSEEQRLEKVRSEFVSTVSHEIRTPLTSIYGAATTLQRRGHELGAQKRDQLIAIIAEQADQLRRLVEQILLAGSLDAGGLRLERGSFDAYALTQTVVQAVRISLSEASSVELDAARDLPEVAGDADGVRQVLTNLLENAAKYSPEGGPIKLALVQQKDHIRFAVSDKGLGIPAHEQERIFEKFYRLDPKQTRGVGGSGLGLYICRELVERMGGRIWVTSEPGGGSIFTFELPHAESGAMATTAEQTEG
jgi:PAS domain S-box-containing protein